jgi:hypothetical protein
MIMGARFGGMPEEVHMGGEVQIPEERHYLMPWFRTNERNEAIKSLYKTYQFVLEVPKEDYNWKWVIIALHNSTQAFMVLALQGTSIFNVIKDPKKLFDAIQNGTDYPEDKLLNFLSLYRDIKSQEKMKKSIDSRIYSGSNEVDDAIRTLNELRNKFIHFIPCGWSIELIMLPRICKQVLSVIEFLIFESGNIRFYDIDNIEKEQLSDLVERIAAELDKIERKYVISYGPPSYQ